MMQCCFCLAVTKNIKSLWMNYGVECCQSEQQLRWNGAHQFSLAADAKRTLLSPFPSYYDASPCILPSRILLVMLRHLNEISLVFFVFLFCTPLPQFTVSPPSIPPLSGSSSWLCLCVEWDSGRPAVTRQQATCSLAQPFSLAVCISPWLLHGVNCCYVLLVTHSVVLVSGGFGSQLFLYFRAELLWWVPADDVSGIAVLLYFWLSIKPNVTYHSIIIPLSFQCEVTEWTYLADHRRQLDRQTVLAKKNNEKQLIKCLIYKHDSLMVSNEHCAPGRNLYPLSQTVMGKEAEQTFLECSFKNQEEVLHLCVECGSLGKDDPVFHLKTWNEVEGVILLLWYFLIKKWTVTWRREQTLEREVERKHNDRFDCFSLTGFSWYKMLCKYLILQKSCQHTGITHVYCTVWSQVCQWVCEISRPLVLFLV